MPPSDPMASRLGGCWVQNEFAVLIADRSVAAVRVWSGQTYPIGPLLLTNGVKYVGDETACYWPLDILGSY